MRSGVDVVHISQEDKPTLLPLESTTTRAAVPYLSCPIGLAHLELGSTECQDLWASTREQPVRMGCPMPRPMWVVCAEDPHQGNTLTILGSCHWLMAPT